MSACATTREDGGESRSGEDQEGGNQAEMGRYRCQFVNGTDEMGLYLIGVYGRGREDIFGAFWGIENHNLLGEVYDLKGILYDAQGVGSGKTSGRRNKQAITLCVQSSTMRVLEISQLETGCLGGKQRHSISWTALLYTTIHLLRFHPSTQPPPGVHLLLLYSPHTPKCKQSIQRQKTQSSRKGFLASQCPRNGRASEDDGGKKCKFDSISFLALDSIATGEILCVC